MEEYCCSFTGAQRRLAYWIGNNDDDYNWPECLRVDVVKTRLNMMRSQDAHWASIFNKIDKIFTIIIT